MIPMIEAIVFGVDILSFNHYHRKGLIEISNKLIKSNRIQMQFIISNREHLDN